MSQAVDAIDLREDIFHLWYEFSLCMCILQALSFRAKRLMPIEQGQVFPFAEVSLVYMWRAQFSDA